MQAVQAKPPAKRTGLSRSRRHVPARIAARPLCLFVPCAAADPYLTIGDPLVTRMHVTVRARLDPIPNSRSVQSLRGARSTGEGVGVGNVNGGRKYQNKRYFQSNTQTPIHAPVKLEYVPAMQAVQTKAPARFGFNGPC